jgi:hypothetical protein
MNRLVLALGAGLLLSSAPRIATADEPRAPASDSPSAGRPTVELDRLDLTKVPGAVAEEAFLRQALVKEARVADWGAGRGAHIEFRVRLDALSVEESATVIRVTCAATGFLPRGRHAKSRLSFGGAPKDRQKVVHHVLEIVARGVVTRLADIERRRRTHG